MSTRSMIISGGDYKDADSFFDRRRNSRIRAATGQISAHALTDFFWTERNRNRPTLTQNPA
jgi:hypothetical protein